MRNKFVGSLLQQYLGHILKLKIHTRTGNDARFITPSPFFPITVDVDMISPQNFIVNITSSKKELKN